MCRLDSCLPSHSVARPGSYCAETQTEMIKIADLDLKNHFNEMSIDVFLGNRRFRTAV